jgi:hypothetical protein
VTGEGGGFGDAGKLTEEAKFTGLEGGPQLVEEQTAEEAREPRSIGKHEYGRSLQNA